METGIPKGFRGRTITYQEGTPVASGNAPRERLVHALEAIVRITHEAPSVMVAGVRGWLTIPVLVDGRLVAVCECFTTERVALDPALPGLLSCAGMALERLYERDHWWAERALLREPPTV